MFCKKCGSELDLNDKFCPSCGAPTSDNVRAQNSSVDQSSFGFGVLSFFFPIVGLILFLVWQNDYPLRAKSCGIGALIGFILSTSSGICFVLSGPFT